MVLSVLINQIQFVNALCDTGCLFKTIVPEQYWDILNVFDEDETNQLPPIRGKGINHEIELLEEEKKKPTVPWGPLYNMSKDKFLVLRKTLTEYLDKGFIRVSNSQGAALVFFC